jgi:hypothetical protein
MNSAFSLDYLVGASEQCRWQGEQRRQCAKSARKERVAEAALELLPDSCDLERDRNSQRVAQGGGLRQGAARAPAALSA